MRLRADAELFNEARSYADQLKRLVYRIENLGSVVQNDMDDVDPALYEEWWRDSRDVASKVIDVSADISTKILNWRRKVALFLDKENT